MIDAPNPGGWLDRTRLIDAFDAIGRAAVANEARLEIAVYGGSALILAGNFRFSTEDVDIAEIGRPWPVWLIDVVRGIGARHGWSDDWFNEAVTVHLSDRASRAADHMEFGSFPRNGEAGLRVVVPSAEYRLALKLKAIRILDPLKGQAEADDIYSLMRILGVGADGAIEILRAYFPKSAADDSKQRFLLKHLKPSEKAKAIDAPVYPR